MFDIGWSEFVVIAIVALIAIGPKELPGVLRMVGQWIGKARRMAAEFQGQFQEAMREAEMADLKQSFDEVKQAASGFSAGNLMTPLEKDVNKALDLEGLEKPASTMAAESAEPSSVTPGSADSSAMTEPAARPDIPVIPATPATPIIDATELPVAERLTEPDAGTRADLPLAMAPPDPDQPATPRAAPESIAAESLRDAKAS
jgi:sec-independent protein translocase protein TatB